MKYIEIKDAKQKAIKMSRIILGGVPFGTTLNREQSFGMMDKYLTYGGNTIDTARVYCDWLENGHSMSERTIGEWVKARNNRKDVILVTKGGHPDSSGVKRLSREDILGDMDTSLETLQTDYVDLYFLHRDDTSLPVSEIMDTLHILVEQGKTKAIGVSNWSCGRIAEANEYAAKHGKTLISVSQIQWSLAQCFPANFNDETLICMNQIEYEQYLKLNIPVMSYTSQANGLFSKAGEDGLEHVPDNLKKFVTPENVRRYKNLLDLCKRKGYSKSAVSLSYITDNKLNAGAIIGGTRMEQLEDSIKAADITLTQDDIDSLLPAT